MTNEKFKIFGPDFIPMLFEIFEYKGLSYEGPMIEDLNMTTPIISLFPRLTNGVLAQNLATVTFLNGVMFRPDSPPDYKLQEVCLPQCKLPSQVAENIACFQFDSRSIHEDKMPMTSEESIMNIKKFQPEGVKVVGIGGHDTKPYLDYEFQLGDLVQLCKTLKKCNKFIGSDSGISHLAGTARISGDIIIIHSRQRHFDELKVFYNIMYPTLRCHHRYHNSKKLFL